MININTMTLEQITEYISTLPARLEAVDLTELFALDDPSAEDIVQAQMIVDGWSILAASLNSLSEFMGKLESVTAKVKPVTMELH
jgi:hypothetical protein